MKINEDLLGLNQELYGLELEKIEKGTDQLILDHLNMTINKGMLNVVQ